MSTQIATPAFSMYSQHFYLPLDVPKKYQALTIRDVTDSFGQPASINFTTVLQAFEKDKFGKEKMKVQVGAMELPVLSKLYSDIELVMRTKYFKDSSEFIMATPDLLKWPEVRVNFPPTNKYSRPAKLINSDGGTVGVPSIEEANKALKGMAPKSVVVEPRVYMSANVEAGTFPVTVGVYFILSELVY